MNNSTLYNNGDDIVNADANVYAPYIDITPQAFVNIPETILSARLTSPHLKISHYHPRPHPLDHWLIILSPRKKNNQVLETNLQ